MEQLFGIENTKKLLKWVFDATKQASTSLADGWQWATDSVAFLDEIFALPGALKTLPHIKNEISELSVEERQELYNFFVAEFDIPNDQVESRIERGILIGLNLIALIEEFRADKNAA